MVLSDFDAHREEEKEEKEKSDLNLNFFIALEAAMRWDAILPCT